MVQHTAQLVRGCYTSEMVCLLAPTCLHSNCAVHRESPQRSSPPGPQQLAELPSPNSVTGPNTFGTPKALEKCNLLALCVCELFMHGKKCSAYKLLLVWFLCASGIAFGWEKHCRSGHGRKHPTNQCNPYKPSHSSTECYSYPAPDSVLVCTANRQTRDSCWLSNKLSIVSCVVEMQVTFEWCKFNIVVGTASRFTCCTSKNTCIWRSFSSVPNICWKPHGSPPICIYSWGFENIGSSSLHLRQFKVNYKQPSSSCSWCWQSEHNGFARPTLAALHTCCSQKHIRFKTTYILLLILNGMRSIELLVQNYSCSHICLLFVGPTWLKYS